MTDPVSLIERTYSGRTAVRRMHRSDANRATVSDRRDAQLSVADMKSLLDDVKLVLDVVEGHALTAIADVATKADLMLIVIQLRKAFP
jgi:hypothetical protein